MISVNGVRFEGEQCTVCSDARCLKCKLALKVQLAACTIEFLGKLHKEGFKENLN